MKRTALLLTALLLVADAATAQSLAFTDVTVIDVTEGVVEPDMTVVIKGDRIVRVGLSGEVEVPAGATRIDGTGRFLIPGLWDMHVNLFNQITGRRPNRWYFPLLVANGITGVREMWVKPGDVSTLTEWRQRTATGELLAPRIAAAGILVDGPGSWWPSADSVATPGEAREFVRGVRAHGLDFVKVYTSLSREAYFAILEEAKRLGIPVAGHVPVVVRASDAAAAGQRSNEHLHQIREGCSTNEETIISERSKLYAGPFTVAQDDSLWERHERMRTNGYHSETCATLAAQLKAAGMWQVPTLVNERGYFLGPEEGADRDPRLAYLPPDERRLWREGLDNYTDIETSSQGGFDERLRGWKITRDVVSVLARGRVPFLAGTNLGMPTLYPGFSLHEELELLVEAGLSPLQALQAATLNPARFFEATDSLGTVEENNLADLVLLDANPLEDISNTQRIAAVVLRGRHLDRGELDELLKQAEEAASRSPDAVRDSLASED